MLKRNSKTLHFLLVLLALVVCMPGRAQTTASLPAGTGPSQVHELILQGFDLISQHEAANAEAAFRQAIDIQPEAEAAHRGLGIALRDQGRFDEAFRELKTAT